MKKLFSMVLALAAATSLAFAASATVDCGSNVEIKATPKTGYHFVRWNDGNTQATRIVEASTTTYTAYFGVDSFYVTYDKGTYGEGSVAQTIKTYFTAATLSSSTFTREGYTQTAWASDAAGTTYAYALGGTYTNNADVTLYPLWEANTYTITYKPGANGTGTQFTDTKTHDVALTLSSSTFTRTGYTQTGWSTTDGGAKAYDLGGNYTANAGATLYPYWEINKYTIQWKVNGTIVETDLNVEYGATPVYNGDEPTKESTAQYDYAFAGWNPTISSVTGDQTYDAQFTATTRKYLITFKNWNNEVLQSSEWEYGTTPSYPGTPTRTEAGKTYTFTGWEPEIVSVTGPAIYTATFEESTNSYSLTVNAGTGGSVNPSGTATYTYNTPVTITATPADCYEFDEWNDGDKNASRTVYITGDATYTATFKKIQYTVTVLSNDENMGTVTVTAQ